MKPKKLWGLAASLAVGAQAVTLSGCSDDQPKPTQKVEFKKSMEDSTIKTDAKKIIEFYAASSTAELYSEAQEQYRSFDGNKPVSMKRLWALHNVTQTIAFNMGVGEGARPHMQFATYADFLANYAETPMAARLRNIAERNLQMAAVLCAVEKRDKDAAFPGTTDAELSFIHSHPFFMDAAADKNVLELRQKLIAAIDNNDAAAKDAALKEAIQALGLPPEQKQGTWNILQMLDKKPPKAIGSVNEIFLARYLKGELADQITAIASGDDTIANVPGLNLYASAAGRQDYVSKHTSKPADNSDVSVPWNINPANPNGIFYSNMPTFSSPSSNGGK